MTFARVKPLGWAFGEVLFSADITTLDANLANAIDGANGGTYTNANMIRLLGELRISTLRRDVPGTNNSYDPWPQFARLSDQDYAALQAHQSIVVFLLNDMTTVRNIVLTDENCVDGNIQVFVGVSGAFGVPIFSFDTGHQVTTAARYHIAITQYRNDHDAFELVWNSAP